MQEAPLFAYSFDEVEVLEDWVCAKTAGSPIYFPTHKNTRIAVTEAEFAQVRIDAG